MEKEIHSYHSLLYSANGALIGGVYPSFRGVAVKWQKGEKLNEDWFQVYFYIDGPISQDLHDECTSIDTEIIADYRYAKIDDQIIRLDYPTPLPYHDYWVYKRKENIYEESLDIIADYDDIYLKAVKATLGCINPKTRGIILGEANNKVYFFFYINEEESQEIEEDCKKIVKRFEYFASKENSEMKILNIKFPQTFESEIPIYQWIYKRKEIYGDGKGNAYLIQWEKENQDKNVAKHTYHNLIHSTKNALIGKVYPSFRGVAVKWKKSKQIEENWILLYFYIDGEISPTLHCQCSWRDKILTDYRYAHIHEEMIRLDYPTPLPHHDYWVYKRKENICEESLDIIADYDDLSLKAVKATLGCINPKTRGITIQEADNQVCFFFYVDGENSGVEEDCKKIVERFKYFASEEVDEVSYKMINIKFPQALPSEIPTHQWIYERKESYTDGIGNVYLTKWEK